LRTIADCVRRHGFVTCEGHRRGVTGSRILAFVTAVVVQIGLSAELLAAAPPRIDGKRAQIAELKAVLEAYDARAGAAAAEHNRALDRLEAIQERERGTRSALRVTKKALDASQEQLANRLVGLYVEGEPSLMEVVLRSGSASGLAAMTDLIDATARSDAAVIDSVRRRRHQLDALGRRLRTDALRAEGEVRVIRAEGARLRLQIEGRRRTLAGARAELGVLVRAEEQRLARLAAEKRTRASARAQASTATSAPRAGELGALPGGDHLYPLAGPSTFSDDWLAARPGGRYHEGIDLFAARGTPVVAVASGTLFRVGYSGISGNRLWLRDSAGTEFFYAHLDGYSPAAREGAAVSKGAVIGYNGDTGDARGTPPHVHFEIHPGGGGPVRPYPVVSAWPRVG